jgi:hypothetical protein
VRAPGNPVPALGKPADIAPWSCVVGDVVARFPEAHQQDPDIPHQWLVTVPCSQGASQGASQQFWFVHGLLQLVK